MIYKVKGEKIMANVNLKNLTTVLGENASIADIPTGTYWRNCSS